MRKHRFMGVCLGAICLGLGLSGCRKQGSTEPKSSVAAESTEQQGLVVSPEEAGVSVNMDNKVDQFKPADYTLPVKDEYVYEYMGFRFKLSDKIKEAMQGKELAMLDDQSPLDQDLAYGLLSFSKLTEEQKNAEVGKMGDGYEKWQEGVERIASIGMFEKSLSEEDISKITKCDSHTKFGESADGKYSYYLSVKSDTDAGTVEEFQKMEKEVIDKKDRPENGFVLSEKSDLEGTMAFVGNSGDAVTDLSNLVTKDIEGKEFSSKDFANYDLTMVNVFATWCTACVQEIPALAEVQKEMQPKGVNIVGVVTDTVDDSGENQEALEKAKLIMERPSLWIRTDRL